MDSHLSRAEAARRRWGTRQCGAPGTWHRAPGRDKERNAVDMSYYAIGVDLGGTNLRVAAVDEGGKLLAKTNLKTEVSQGREHVIDELCRATSSMIQEMRQKLHDGCALCGIGVGVPGLVDSESGRLLDSPNLPGWSNYDVRRNRAASRYVGGSAERCQRSGAGRTMAGSGTRLREHVHVHAGYRGGRSFGSERRDLAGMERDGRRAGALQCGTGRPCLQLRELWLSGAICFGYGSGADDAGSPGGRDGRFMDAS